LRRIDLEHSPQPFHRGVAASIINKHIGLPDLASMISARVNTTSGRGQVERELLGREVDFAAIAEDAASCRIDRDAVRMNDASAWRQAPRRAIRISASARRNSCTPNGFVR
jgi:hypothetical protein